MVEAEGGDAEESEGEGCEADGDCDGAGEVYFMTGFAAAGFADFAAEDEEGYQADREVYKKDIAPEAGVGEGASDDRSADSDNGSDGRPGADGFAAFFFVDEGGQQGQAAGDHEGSAGALDDAEGDEVADGGGESAGCGA